MGSRYDRERMPFTLSMMVNAESYASLAVRVYLKLSLGLIKAAYFMGLFNFMPV